MLESWTLIQLAPLLDATWEVYWFIIYLVRPLDQLVKLPSMVLVYGLVIPQSFNISMLIMTRFCLVIVLRG